MAPRSLRRPHPHEARAFAPCEMGLVSRFPAATTISHAVAAIGPASFAERVTRLTEECLQAYGRCLLARGTKDEARFADVHLFYRQELRKAVSETSVKNTSASSGKGAAVELHAAMGVLFASIDAVLTANGVRCAVVTSGLAM